MNGIANAVTTVPLEQEAIKAKCFHPTGTFVEFKKEEIEQSIPERFEKIVGRFPDRIAVKTKHKVFTYTALNNLAEGIARAILKRNVGDEQPIALLLEQSGQSIAAILGVLKAGKTYLPLDSSYPPARLIATLQDSRATLILTDDSNLSLGQELASNQCRLFNLAGVDPTYSTRYPTRTITANAVAAIFYTSGSTGKPKGVIQTHRNILHRVMIDTNNFHICPEDRLSLLSSPTYSVSLRNLFGALLNGAALCPFNIKDEGTGCLADWLNQQMITIYFSVPSVFRQFASSLEERARFQTVRLIYLGGEIVTKRDVQLYKDHFSQNTLLVNSLAANETGQIRNYFMDNDTLINSDLVPAGYELKGKRIALLDDKGREVPCGQIGEIAVKSRYLSPGYWRNPDLTNASFIPDSTGGDERTYRTGDLGQLLSDGCLLYFGRKGLRVKIRGAAVELGEVESGLRRHPAVQDTVVVAQENDFGESRLVAYFTSHIEPAPGVSMLRSFLKDRLPDYMIPSVFVRLDALPLTPNGKIDRRALPDPDNSKANVKVPFVAPRTSAEETLAKIWADVLSNDQVGIYDDFFDLGGHSLAATRIVSQVIKKFHLELPLKTFFDSPTVAEMALVIIQNQANKASDQDIERLLSELEAMPEAEAGRKLASTKASRENADAKR